MIKLTNLILLSVCSLIFANSPYRPKTHKGDFCKIPFEKNGKVYHDCTNEGRKNPWCINSKGNIAKCADVPNFSNCKISPPNVTAKEVEFILETVNKIRAKEPALRMAKIRWNTELAQTAQSLSDKCKIQSSNPNLCSAALPMGQISFMTMSSNPQPKKWSQFFQEFLNQKSSYKFDMNECKSESCDGYKQLVNAQTTDIGCGVTSCNRPGEYEDFYYCHFFPPSYIDKPYEKGNKGCNNCNLLNEKYEFQCNNNLCEIIDSPAKVKG